MHALRFLPLALLSACATVSPMGKVVTKDAPVPAFTAVEIASGIEATVQPGPASVRIEADEAVMPYVFVKVMPTGLLRVELDHPGVAFMRPGKIVATITGPVIQAISASGGSRVTATLTAAKDCAIEGSGGSDLTIAGVACESLAIDASGGTEIEANGTAQKIAIEASGGSTVAVRQIEATHVRVEASGASEVKAFASAELTAELSGGTNLYVAGRPPVRSIEASGGTQIVDIP